MLGRIYCNSRLGGLVGGAGYYEERGMEIETCFNWQFAGARNGKQNQVQAAKVRGDTIPTYLLAKHVKTV